MPRAECLTRKQARFLDEYLKDLNGTRAAVAAGYSPSSARRIASDLLAKPHVRDELARLEAAAQKAAGITAEGVLEQLRRIAFFDVATIYETRRESLRLESYEKAKDSLPERYKCGCTILQQNEESLAKGCGVHGPETGYVFPLTVTVDVKRMLHPADWPADARTCLASYDTVIRNLTAGDGKVDVVAKVKLESKLVALDMLARHLNLLAPDRETNIDNSITIQWLAPEPPPPLPDIHVRPGDGAPVDRIADRHALPTPAESMGFAPDPAGPQDRTSVYSIPEPADDPMAEVGTSGMSLRAQRKMFPELRPEKKRL